MYEAVVYVLLCRTKPRAHDDVPGRPAAQRPEARPQPQVPAVSTAPSEGESIDRGQHQASMSADVNAGSMLSGGVQGFVPVVNAFGQNGMSFSAGFGFFPSLFGLQFVSQPA